MNDPNRIEEMTRRHLLLGPTTSDQMITSVAGIPQRLQPVDPNNAHGPGAGRGTAVPMPRGSPAAWAAYPYRRRPAPLSSPITR